MTAASQNRATQFIISMPLPVSLAKTNIEADIHYTELRRMFNATMKANMQTLPNVQCCENENLAGLSGSTCSSSAANGNGNNANSVGGISGGVAIPPGPVNGMLSAINNPALDVDGADLTAPNCTPIKKVNLQAKKETIEDGKYILDNHQLTAAGMRKLARNWDNCLARIDRSSDGQLLLRRSSDSSESTAGSGWSEDNSRQQSSDIVEPEVNDLAKNLETSQPKEIGAQTENANGQDPVKTTRSGSASSSSSGGSRSTDSLEARPHWKPLC